MLATVSMLRESLANDHKDSLHDRGLIIDVEGVVVGSVISPHTDEKLRARSSQGARP